VGSIVWLCQTSERAARAHAGEVRLGVEHGRHVPDMWRPQGHFNEHVVAYEVGKVEGDFGLVLGQIGPWAQNDFCNP
jgi:hypothetical protein